MCFAAKGNTVAEPIKIQAWHFTGAALRDGRPIPADGEVLHHDGPLVMCASGLHWCRSPLAALGYAPGATLCRDEVWGDVVEDDDKGIARNRVILWRMDATDLLREFARSCALDVVHLWDAPEIVLDYLRTGDETKRRAADAAAYAAYAAAYAADAARAARAAQNARLTDMIDRARERTAKGSAP
jgi:hypothetical protein